MKNYFKYALSTLFAFSICSPAFADSLVLKFRNLTKKEQIMADEYMTATDEYVIFGTNQGLKYVHIDEPAIDIFVKASNQNRCVKLTGSKTQLKSEYIESGFATSGFKATVVKCK